MIKPLVVRKENDEKVWMQNVITLIDNRKNKDRLEAVLIIITSGLEVVMWGIFDCKSPYQPAKVRPMRSSLSSTPLILQG